jgi:hypothetical protein
MTVPKTLAVVLNPASGLGAYVRHYKRRNQVSSHAGLWLI